MLGLVARDGYRTAYSLIPEYSLPDAATSRIV
jgi:hypothetical protein